ncbi:peptidase S8/S53 domain-containing protein [Hyaloraphidium curvatum]|nr:peptidase S8/S53 domain-containing protein [Hyaloraphidium curvatum]
MGLAGAAWLALALLSLAAGTFGAAIGRNEEKEWIAVFSDGWDGIAASRAWLPELLAEHDPAASLVRWFSIPGPERPASGSREADAGFHAALVASRSPSLPAALRADRRVRLVEPNGAVWIDPLPAPFPPMRHAAPGADRTWENVSFVTQPGAPYNLARLSSRAPGPDWYSYGSRAGAGVRVYVVDTGVMVEHAEFRGRAARGASFVQGEAEGDQNGHGTHVAGTIAGFTYGAAKEASIIEVKVLNSQGGGSWSNVIAGIEWIVGQVRASQDTSIMHMSITGTQSAAVQLAIGSALSALPEMLHVVAAAGNTGGNACDYTPGAASRVGAITVAATDRNDSVPAFSNRGPCVTIWAPGTGIVSAAIGEPRGRALRALSGTSMAAPLVTGAAALILSYRRSLTSQSLREFLVSVATMGAIGDLPADGSPDGIAYGFFVGGNPNATEPDAQRSTDEGTTSEIRPSGSADDELANGRSDRHKLGPRKRAREIPDDIIL